MENKKKITPTFVNGMFVFMLLVYVLGSYGLRFVFDIIRSSNPNFSISIIASLLLSQGMIWLGLILAFIISRRITFYKDDFRFKSGVGKTVATFALVPVYTACVMPLVWFFNLVTMFFAENQIAEATTSMEVYPLIVQLIIIACVPAVSEELICRGALYGGLKRHGILGAIIISGLFFGILHLNINQFAYATALGIAFCILNEATGFIYSSMFGHFLVNGFSVVLSYILSMGIDSAEITETVEAVGMENPIQALPTVAKVVAAIVYAFMAVVGLGLAFLLIWAIASINGRTAHMKNIFKKGSANPYSEDGEKKNQFNVFFFIAVILGFGYMIVTEFILGI